MNEQITLEEVYRLLGERDILIHKLQQEVARLQSINKDIPEITGKPNGSMQPVASQ